MNFESGKGYRTRWHEWPSVIHDDAAGSRTRLLLFLTPILEVASLRKCDLGAFSLRAPPGW